MPDYRNIAMRALGLMGAPVNDMVKPGYAKKRRAKSGGQQAAQDYMNTLMFNRRAPFSGRNNFYAGRTAGLMGYNAFPAGSLIAGRTQGGMG